jgi:hypothetical protein
MKKKSIDAFGRFGAAALILFAMALGSGLATVALAQGQGAPSVATISEITLERDCSGCPTGSILALRRDGTATYAVTGKARLGTESRTSTGRLPAGEFEKLARFIVAQGFFDMKEQYDDPQVRDGAWTTTSVMRGGQDKRVFRRESAGPAALAAVEGAIDALKARIEFSPAVR